MGQAWCKEKTTKAQDSKSPLDRVFVRCAHRIYPSLKEEGSVLGGATQRVTSSEIGYAGSPPREVLTRGRSIDSVDRPFHPSDWVDVNLEVPCTPRPSSVLTNLTVDTSLYPATNPTSSCTNLKDVTPIPPPRRRKRNKGRPLPPKPDEASAENPKKTETGGDEPLYSSVRSPKSSEDEQEEETKHRSQDDEIRDGRRTKEIYEHKVNGTGRIISSDVVSGKRSFDNSQRKAYEEYERFARNRTSRDSSTPNREEKRKPRQIEDSPKDAKKSSSDARTKNYSTVSLPNYDELDVTRHRSEETDDREQEEDKVRKSRRPVRSSTGSLPAETFLSPFSEKTSVRLEDYIPKSESLPPYQVMQKLDCGANGMVKDEYVKYDPSKSEDWELADIDNCEVHHQRQFSFEDASEINGEGAVREEDVVDFPTYWKDERESHSMERDISRSPIHLEKPEAFGKTPSPVLGQPKDTEVDPNRSYLRYYEPPTLTDCKISSTCESPASKAPFFLDETKHRLALDTIEESIKSNPKSDRSDQSRTIFTRSLSNESEPNEDTYETKELESRACDLVRTISKESLPREMLEEQELDGFLYDKHAKNAHNKLKKSLDDWKSITPPPSPEPKIKPEILDSDHSTLLKVLKEETAEESNLSSMTPSLTELEAALSDMLEKEDSVEGSKESNGSNEQILKNVEPNENKTSEQVEKEIVENSDGFKNVETKSNDENLVDSEGKNEATVALKQVLEDRKPPGRKVSFCSWEESVANLETLKDQGFVELPVDLNKEDQKMENVGCPVDIPPEKPSRLNRNLDDVMENVDVVPTPPRRRNRSLGVVKKEPEVAQNGSAVKEALPNDRLI